MAEKVAGKKEEQQQQANKKSNKNQQQQQKKKRAESQKLVAWPVEKAKKKKTNQSKTSNNHVSASNNNSNNNNSKNNSNNSSNNKKNKEKKENKNQGKKSAKRNVNKPGGGFCRGLFKLCFFTVASALAILGFLYIVDIKKYRSVVQGGEKALYSMRQYLPSEVVTQGEKVYLHMVRPTVVVAVDKVLVLFNHTSTMLNTNPAIKDHWSNINEISAVIGERLAEYMRTVYKQIPIYYDYAKNKLF